MKNNDRINFMHVIENPYRPPFAPDAQFVNSGRNDCHRPAERHANVDAFLQISQRFSDLTTDGRRLCSNEIQSPCMKKSTGFAM